MDHPTQPRLSGSYTANLLGNIPGLIRFARS